MGDTAGKLTIKFATMAIGIPVGIATRRGVVRAWAAITTDQPPSAAGHRRVEWSDDVVLAIVSSASVVLSQRLVRNGVERAYRVLFGEPPVTLTFRQRLVARQAKRNWTKKVGPAPKPQTVPTTAAGA